MSRRGSVLWFLPRNWREREAAEQERLAQEAEHRRANPPAARRIGKRAAELNARE